MKRILLFGLALLLFVFTSKAQQPGSIDLSFNTIDKGKPSNGLSSVNVVTTKVYSNGKIFLGGSFATYNTISANNAIRLNADGTRDTTFIVGTGFNNSVYASAIQSDGKIIVGGTFTTYKGTTANRIVRLNSDGSTDATFNIGSGANNSITSIAIQADGKILVGGSFTTFNGVSKNNIIRLNADGTTDATFNIGTGTNGAIEAIYVQSDGKVLLGGSFTTYNGTTKNRIVRVSSLGAIDATFNVGTGANNDVYDINIQSDGKVLIAGSFTTYNGTAASRVARLSSTGTLDNTFNMGTGPDGNISCIFIQSDGKIMIGGYFWNFNGVVCNSIARLNSNGSLDNTYSSPVWGYSVESIYVFSDGNILHNGRRYNSNGIIDYSFNLCTGANASVNGTIIQPDGKIIVVGAFTSFNGGGSKYIVRLNTDGTLDAGFNPGTGANNTIYCIGFQSDGKIIIGGDFTSFNGSVVNRLARLNADGSFDNTFNSGGTGVTGYVYTLTVQNDDKIVIGGYFNYYNGVFRYCIARVNSDGSHDESFNPGSGVNGTASIKAVAVQNDGKIIAGGTFTSFNGTVKKKIARLNPDGSLDNSLHFELNGDINATVIQNDGKIIIGGNFSYYDYLGSNQVRLMRINMDGSLDRSFSSNTGPNSDVYCILIQPDGKIFIGGFFQTYNGISRNTLAKLNANGSLNTVFNVGTGTNYDIKTMSLQADGNLIIGGGFTSYNGTGKNSLARINALACSTPSTLTVTATNSFNLNSKNYTESGTYVQDLVSASNCDSTLTLNLTVRKLPLSTNSLNFGFIQTGEVSTNKYFTVSGSNLFPASGNITITPPSGFALALPNGSGFSSSPILLPYENGILPLFNIFVRFLPDQENKLYAENIFVSGGGTTTQNIAVTGTTVASYCTVSATSPGYMGITRVIFNTIDNTSSMAGNVYDDYSNINTTVAKGQTFLLQIKGSGWSQVFGAFFDWNIDGDFSDAGEQIDVVSYDTIGIAMVSIPVNANAGNVRMRIVSDYVGYIPVACGTLGYGTCEDYTLIIGSSFCSNPTNGGNISGTENACNSLNVGVFANVLLPSGFVGELEYKWQQSTTDEFSGFTDIENSNFRSLDHGILNTTTWFKRLSRVSCAENWNEALESNVIKITIIQGLCSWLTVSTDTINFGYNVMNVASSVHEIILNGGNLTPEIGNISITAPVGYEISLNSETGFTASTMQIPYSLGSVNSTFYVRCKPLTPYTFQASNIQITGGSETANIYVSSFSTYCGVSTSATGYMGIQQVTFNTINNNSGVSYSAYENYTLTSTSVDPGQTYNISVTCFSYDQDVKTWIDWNLDGDFDANESILNKTTIGFTTSGTVTVPANLLPRKTVMRVRSDNPSGTAISPCGSVEYGQTEDYTVIITAPPCTALSNGGTIAGEQTICASDQPSNITNTILPSGGTSGINYKWQKSVTDALSGFMDIANSNSENFNPNILNNTTWFKRIARASCETDWNTAVESNVIEITVISGPAVNISTTDISCSGGNSIVTVTATGGIEPYAGTGEFTVPAGEYTYIVSDAGICTSTVAITITEPPVLNINTSVQSACVDGNIAITVTGTGGTAPYTGTGTFTVFQGTHNYTITDANNCTDSESIIATVSTLSVSSVITGIGCEGGNTGAIALQISGGTEPYSVIWSNNSTNQTITGLAAGAYQANVSDASGCLTTIDEEVIWAGPCNTKVRALDCGTTVNTLAKYIYCNTVTGATDYEWEFSATGYFFTRTKGSSSTAFYLANATGIEYNSTYEVRVRAYKNGVWGNFSDVCQIVTGLPPTTQLSTAYCGITTTNLTQYIYCNAIAGATDYEWEFSHSASSFTFIRTRDMANNSMSLSWIIGLEYEKTYDVRIRVKIGTQWSNYGTVCTITTPAVPTTKLQSVYCGITVNSLSNYFYCDAVAGATNYEWEFTNIADNSITTFERGSSNYSLSFAFVSGAAFNKTYNVRVRTQIGTQWGNFASICQISTPAFPTTKVRTDFCGATVTSLRDYIYCDAVKGATDYEWKFENAADNFLFTKMKGSNSTSINLSWITGLANGKTYNVNVKAKVGTTWGSFGTICQITTPSGAKLQGNDANEESTFNIQHSTFNISLYPNPANKNSAITVALTADVNLNGTTINIYNIIGQIVYTQKINADANEYLMTIDLNNKFNSGLFIIQAEMNGEVKRMKLIVD